MQKKATRLLAHIHITVECSNVFELCKTPLESRKCWETKQMVAATTGGADLTALGQNKCLYLQPRCLYVCSCTIGGHEQNGEDGILQLSYFDII